MKSPSCCVTAPLISQSSILPVRRNLESFANHLLHFLVGHTHFSFLDTPTTYPNSFLGIVSINAWSCFECKPTTYTSVLLVAKSSINSFWMRLVGTHSMG